MTGDNTANYLGMNEIFEHKNVIISGGLGDIGRAIAILFAKAGANIAIGDIQPESDAGEFISMLKQYPVAAIYHRVDVADAEAVRKWVNEVEQEIGVPDIVIVNAATATFVPIHEMTVEQWNSELSVNLDGAFYLAQSAAARLLQHKLPGRIVFMGSWAAHAVHPNIPAYSVSKAGIRMLCKCLALELAPHQILVNELAPGYVDAGLSGKIFKEQPGAKDEARNKVPIKKIMSAEDVAHQVLFLCNPANKHITGSTLLMDGGLSLLS